MTSPDPASGGDSTVNLGKYASSEVLATLGVSREQFSRHQEEMRRSFFSPESRGYSASPSYLSSSLPFPLNLPPSYPVQSTTSSSTRTNSRKPQLWQNASFTAGNGSKNSEIISKDSNRPLNTPTAVSTRMKVKGTLDAFMDSRQGGHVQDSESSGSDSDTFLRKMPVFQSSDEFSDAFALPSSSPPSSSPLRTPNESARLSGGFAYASSPTPRPRSHPPTRIDASDPPFIFPPGPYSLEKPSWSLAALIGQALNASRSGALAVNDIYSYVSTVYPYYDRSEPSWMNSIRHSLSVNEAFEYVLGVEANKRQAVKGKGRPKVRNGLWKIAPGHEACFAGGNFVKKGARGAGPGRSQGSKRRRDDDSERNDQKPMAEGRRRRLCLSPSTSNTLSTPMPPHFPIAHPHSSSPPRTIYSSTHGGSAVVALSRRASSPPSLTTSQSTAPSDASLPDPFDLPPSSPIMVQHDTDDLKASSPGSPDLPLAFVTSRNVAMKGRALSFSSSLEPGFELTRTCWPKSSPHPSMLNTEDVEVSRDLFTRVLASTSSAHATSSQVGPSRSPKAARLLFPPPFPSSQLPDCSFPPARLTTPPPCQSNTHTTLSPVRTPKSHNELHTSPSRSLAHYKSVTGRHTPPPPGQENMVVSTPRRLSFPTATSQASPLRTPARSIERYKQGYDPYDPNTLLADELASIRNANNLQESPGGFFGKEGRKLMYESPGIPSRSHWRFRDEL